MGAGERPRLIILGSILGVGVVVFLAKMVLFSGGGGSKSATPTAFRPQRPPRGRTTTSTTPSSRSTRTPATFECSRPRTRSSP